MQSAVASMPVSSGPLGLSGMLVNADADMREGEPLGVKTCKRGGSTAQLWALHLPQLTLPLSSLLAGLLKKASTTTLDVLKPHAAYGRVEAGSAAAGTTELGQGWSWWSQDSPTGWLKCMMDWKESNRVRITHSQGLQSGGESGQGLVTHNCHSWPCAPLTFPVS